MTQDTGATTEPTVPAGPQDIVTIKLPAAGAYLSVLRTATAGLAARLDFTLDEIEDLRIAVDEACAMLLTQAVPGADLECRFTLDSDSMRVGVSVLTFAMIFLMASSSSMKKGILAPRPSVSGVLIKPG